MEVKPGYKQTEVGVLPEDWEVRQLKDIVSKIIDNRGKTPPYSDNKNIELIETVSISFVNQYPDYSKVTKFVSDNVYNNWFRGHPVKGDILISTVGEYSGCSAIMKENRGTIAQNIIALHIKEVNPAYVFYWTRSKSFKNQLDQVMMNQAQPSLRVPWLLKFYLNVPQKKAEQEAIAKSLSDTDALISSLEKLIAKKRDLKRAAMQQLLTGQKRLPGFTGEWEVKRLGDILKVRHGKSQHGIVKSDGKYPILATSGEIGRTDAHIYDKPSVLIGRKGTIDSPQFVDSPFWTIDTLFFTEISSEADAKFVFYKFNTINWRSYNEASGVPSLNASTIENIEIDTPLHREQTAIAEVLSDMDAELAALEQRCDKTRALKQGMMQELLTGRIRLI